MEVRSINQSINQSIKTVSYTAFDALKSLRHREVIDLTAGLKNFVLIEFARVRHKQFKSRELEMKNKQGSHNYKFSSIDFGQSYRTVVAEVVIVIVISKLLKRHSKAKRRASAYSRALSRLINLSLIS